MYNILVSLIKNLDSLITMLPDVYKRQGSGRINGGNSHGKIWRNSMNKIAAVSYTHLLLRHSVFFPQKVEDSPLFRSNLQTVLAEVTGQFSVDCGGNFTIQDVYKRQG